MKTRQITRILGFISPYRRRLVVLVLLTVFLSILSMSPPLVIRAIIDEVLTDGRHELFRGLVICMITLPVALAICRYMHTLSVAYLGQRFVFDIRNALYDHMLGLSLRFYGEHSAGKLVNRLMGDSGTVQQMLTGRTITVISDLVSASVAIAVTFYINWRMALLLLFMVLGFVVNYRLNIGRIRRAMKAARGSLDRLSGGVQNRLVANVAVKTFGTEEREHGFFRDDLGEVLGFSTEAMLASNTFSMNTQFLKKGGRAIIYFAGCAMILRGDMTYGDVMAFTVYTMRLLGPAVRFSELIRQLQAVGIAVERLFEVFDEEPEIRNSPAPVSISRLSGAVDFNRVFFHYERDNPVIRGLDLHISPGETVAVIGPTGCGKSTIMSLLLRFFDVCGGSLCLDGIDIRKIELSSLRRQFGVVLQEPLLFSTSIADNIRYGRPSATDREVREAARIAEIDDFIVSLYRGYDTMIGTSGVELSVGQKQRITIARAVAADPAILVMDEATSALDSDSERAIQTAMDRVLKGRTSFVVAHRLSTVKNADRIVLLDDGTIAEMGTHDQLMAVPDSRYRDLYTKHMGSGILEDAS